MFKNKGSLWLFLIPGSVLVSVLYVVPFIGGFYYSLTDGTNSGNIVGISNYVKLWKNSMFQLGLMNTVELTLICVSLLFVSSIAVAFVMHRMTVKTPIVFAALVMPYCVPSVTVSYVWRLVFSYRGMLNKLIARIGYDPIPWFESSAIRVPVVLLFLWRNVGVGAVLVYVALQRIPNVLYEYADLEGAGNIVKTCRITLPLISPTLYAVIVYAWIQVASIFNEMYILSGAYPDGVIYTVQHYMNNMYGRMNFHMVATAAYSMIFLISIPFVCFLRIYQHNNNK